MFLIASFEYQRECKSTLITITGIDSLEVGYDYKNINVYFK